MTSLLNEIIAVPIEYLTTGAIPPRFNIFVVLRDALIGFGLDPHSATVWVAAAPIISVSLIYKVMAWRKLCRISSPTTENTITATDAAAQSLDDDWADIALELERENRNV